MCKGCIGSFRLVVNWGIGEGCLAAYYKLASHSSGLRLGTMEVDLSLVLLDKLAMFKEKLLFLQLLQ